MLRMSTYFNLLNYVMQKRYTYTVNNTLKADPYAIEQSGMVRRYEQLSRFNSSVTYINYLKVVTQKKLLKTYKYLRLTITYVCVCTCSLFLFV